MLTNRTIIGLCKCWRTGHLPSCANVDKQDIYRVVQMLTNRTKMLKTPNSRAIVYLRPIFSSRKAVKNNPENKQKKTEYFQTVHETVVVVAAVAWRFTPSQPVWLYQGECDEIGTMAWAPAMQIVLCNAMIHSQSDRPWQPRKLQRRLGTVSTWGHSWRARSRDWKQEWNAGLCLQMAEQPKRPVKRCKSQAHHCQSSGAVWKSRWPSWAFRPNEPYGFCGRKATPNRA